MADSEKRNAEAGTLLVFGILSTGTMPFNSVLFPVGADANGGCGHRGR